MRGLERVLAGVLCAVVGALALALPGFLLAAVVQALLALR